MKKKLLSLALALAVCLTPLSAAAAVDVNAAGGGGFEPVDQSLDQPAPLPAHLAQYEASDLCFIYDVDPAKLLEITTNEWVYVVLEGTEFTVYQNPSWRGMVTDVSIFAESENDYNEYCFYSAFFPDTSEDIRYMPPITVTFGHDVEMPDGTVADIAEIGTSYSLHLGVCFESEEDGGMMMTATGENFMVIPAIAYASTQTVDIDGKAVEFQMYSIKDANGNDTNYVKVRDVALALDGTAAQFNVGWDGNVNLETGKAYTARNGQENNTPYSGNQPFVAATSTTKVDGEAANLTAFVITDQSGNGSTYYKLRDLGAALGFTVDWSGERGIFIETE